MHPVQIRNWKRDCLEAANTPAALNNRLPNHVVRVLLTTGLLTLTLFKVNTFSTHRSLSDLPAVLCPSLVRASASINKMQAGSGLIVRIVIMRLKTTPLLKGRKWYALYITLLDQF